jgi:hypothetical protein
MKLSKVERETIIVRNAAEDIWHISTADPTIIKKMTRLQYTVVKQSIPTPYHFFECPKRCVSFRSLKKRAVGPSQNLFKSKNHAIQPRKTK